MLSDPKVYTSEYVVIGVLLNFDGTNTAMYIEKYFRKSAPRLWNKLPNQIKLAGSKIIFCKVHKTHLSAYLKYIKLGIYI